MKRILVVSDSHGCDENVERAIKAAGKFDIFVHLGDIGPGYKNMRAKIMAQCVMVRGNTDYGVDLPEVFLFEVGNHKILATHGHRQNVNSTMYDLRTTAINNGCDVAMFGHTHVPCKRNEEGIFLLNPGSVSKPRQVGYQKTYMIVEIDDNDEINAKICMLEA